MSARTGRSVLLLEMLGCVRVQPFRQIPFGLRSVENGIIKRRLRGSAEGGRSLFFPGGMLFKSWKKAADLSLS